MVDLRESLKKMYPDCDFDVSYSFYYDETNNIRKFHNKTGQLNYKEDGNFILGGILFKEEPDIDTVFDDLNLQKNVREVKIKHIAKGDFFSILDNSRINIVLKFLNDKKIYIHYHSVNLLYFAIVDIIDSAILGAKKESSYSLNTINELKSILFEALSLNIDKTVEFFHYFNYPNVEKENFDKFIYHIKKNIKNFKLHKKGISEIIEILDTSVSNKNLPFITDEESNVFIENFFPFYHYPTANFINSTHYFDNEDNIKKIFVQMKNNLNNRNYHFIDSENSKFIQLADVVVGMLGKFYQYINTISRDQIRKHYKSLNENQIDNYNLLIDIINKAINKNPAFVNNTMGLSQHIIFNEILEKKKFT